MRNFISVLALAGAAAQFAAAQSTNDLLGCAQSVLGNITVPSYCDGKDISCLCSNASFVSSVKTAIGKNCSPSDQKKALSFAENLCDQVPSPRKSHPMIPSERRAYAPEDGECTCASGSSSPSSSGYSPESTPSGSTPFESIPSGSTSGSTPGAAVPAGSPAPSAASGTTGSSTSSSISSSSSAAVPSSSGSVPATNAPSSSATSTGTSPVQGSQSASSFKGTATQSLPSLVAPLAMWIFAVFAVM